jgi:hypothetical protein
MQLWTGLFTKLLGWRGYCGDVRNFAMVGSQIVKSDGVVLGGV